jgi:hypothetical protein
MEEFDQNSLYPLLEHLETNMCLGRESNPRVACRRALKQRAIQTASNLLIGTTICAGILPSYCRGDFLPATHST